ncbi:hypothetical protein HYC85_000326 [Camellia sinensis]|uniref:Uncharacterized protein n=1 Tax=Camellia sinensis TaxID=4442 RepID=A0A7J7I3B8_CAMSI|nr:hypothetical protein HYC85_000326 [Camellia sinensis]
MVGPLLELQVAGRPPPLAGRPRAKWSRRNTGRPPLFRILPGVYITDMWLKVGNSNSRVFNIAFEEEGQKWKVELLAGHELLGSSQVCTSQICG